VVKTRRLEHEDNFIETFGGGRKEHSVVVRVRDIDGNVIRSVTVFWNGKVAIE